MKPQIYSIAFLLAGLNYASSLSGQAVVECKFADVNVEVIDGRSERGGANCMSMPGKPKPWVSFLNTSEARNRAVFTVNWGDHFSAYSSEKEKKEKSCTLSFYVRYPKGCTLPFYAIGLDWFAYNHYDRKANATIDIYGESLSKDKFIRISARSREEGIYEGNEMKVLGTSAYVPIYWTKCGQDKDRIDIKFRIKSDRSSKTNRAGVDLTAEEAGFQNYVSLKTFWLMFIDPSKDRKKWRMKPCTLQAEASIPK